MEGTDEKGGLPSADGPSPNRDPATATKDPDAKPKAKGEPTAPRSNDPDQLAAEIEKTRDDLAETLDAIAEKVSPKRVAKRTTKKAAASAARPVTNRRNEAARRDPRYMAFMAPWRTVWSDPNRRARRPTGPSADADDRSRRMTMNSGGPAPAGLRRGA